MGQKRGYRQTKDHVRKRMESRLETLRKKPKPLSADQLEAMYWGENMTCVDIAKREGKDPKTIWAWMRHYGIKTRPRGHNVGQLPSGRKPGFKLTEEHKQAIRDARKRDGHVPYLKNGEHWLKSAAKEDTPNWKGGVTPERQKFYCTDEWKEAVKAVWARADAKCERCGKHHNTQKNRGNFHIHHIVSFAVKHLRAEASNLALLCRECHLFVHSKKNVDNEFIGDSDGRY